MNYYEIKTRTLNNGIKATVKIPNNVIRLENNILLDKVHELNELILKDEYELRIRELLNRINKAIAKIQETYEYGDEWHWDSGAIRDYVEKIEEILKGETHER